MRFQNAKTKNEDAIMKNKTTRNSFLLLLTAFIWGVAFVAQSKGGDAIGPFTFNCLRFLIGGMVV